jgi:hypothetical protein
VVVGDTVAMVVGGTVGVEVGDGEVGDEEIGGVVGNRGVVVGDWLVQLDVGVETATGALAWIL